MYNVSANIDMNTFRQVIVSCKRIIGRQRIVCWGCCSERTAMILPGGI